MFGESYHTTSLEEETLRPVDKEKFEEKKFADLIIMKKL